MPAAILTFEIRARSGRSRRRTRRRPQPSAAGGVELGRLGDLTVADVDRRLGQGDTPLLERHRALGARLDRLRRLAHAGPVQRASSRSTAPSASAPASSTCRTWASSSSRARRPVRRSPMPSSSDPPSLAVGRAHYSMICAEDGGILDDLIVYRLADERFLVVANASNAPARQRPARRAERRLPGDPRRPLAGDGAGRGPGSAVARRSSAPLTDVDLGALRYYAIAEGRVAGIDALVARTGYTGEDGFEVFVENARAGELWDALLEAGQAAGPRAGRARRSRHAAARGRDAALRQRSRRRPSTRTTPDSAGSSSWPSRRLRRPRRPRTGRRRRPAPPARRADVRGRGIARHGYPVYAGERETGAITSGAPSPDARASRSRMAYVAPGDAEPGTMLAVGIRDALVPAEVVPLPFYRRSG